MRPSRNYALMQTAQVFAERSTCSRAQVGVVIAREGRILVTGYNGAPAGMDHCDHTCKCRQMWKFSEDRTEHEATCPDINNPCTVSVHAEANAIAYAARWGIKIEGAELFTTFSPCLACGQLIVNAGITKVVYATLHRDRRGLELCQKAGIEVVYERDMDDIS